MKSNFIKKLNSFDSCTISDAMDKIGLFGGVYHLKQLTSIRKIVGQVVTIKLDKSDKITTGNTTHLGAKAIDAAIEDTVIVVDNQGKIDVGAWGGILSIAAKAAGIIGVIIEGSVRDVDEIRDIDLPVYARGTVPVSARGRVSEIANNIPIKIGAVKVNPDDYVICDGSGIVFIPQKNIAAVLREAIIIAQKEKVIIERLKKGTSVIETLDINYEKMLQ